ncbi:MAG: 2-hydroxyacid dehydrogenase [Spartobacteria bacterium]|nr:2-hydroxyacid dehydrogenase [Spartobacteria bacterium]
MNKRIAFFDAKPYDQVFFNRLNETFLFDITFFPNRLNEKTVGLAQGHDAVCAFVNDRIGADVIDKLVEYGVGIIAMRCAGYNNIDLKHIFGKIHVLRVPAYSPHAVAEHAVALMLTLNRNTHRAYYRTRDNNFQINGLLGFDMFGKTAGVVGAGKIGRETVKILRGFGMRVLVYDRYRDEAFAEQHACEYVELETLYRESDIITLHCPLTPENVHMINAETLAMMKPHVMIINTGRGGLIDTPALIDALKARRLGAAGLDVYEEEEDYFFEDFSNEIVSDDVLARLTTFPNVLITSHQAFFTHEALSNIAETTLNNVADFFDGARMDNEICYKCCNKACTKKTNGTCW